MKLPETPYYAVIFISELRENASDYGKWAEYMVKLAEDQPGFLGIHSVRDNQGITISYWESESAIHAWRTHAEHQLAQKLGKSDFYRYYKVEIARVERAYEWWNSAEKD